MRASFIASEIGIGLRRNLTMTIAVVVTTTVSLFFFGASLWLTAQIDTMKGYWYDKVEVSIFLCTEDSPNPACVDGAPAEAVKDQIEKDVTALPQVQTVYFESKEEAYKLWSEDIDDSLAQQITPEQMPESFRVKLVDPEDYAVVTSAFQGRPGVESVEDYEQTLRPLFDALNGLRQVGLVVAGLQMLAATFMISNTIRVAAYNRRRETGIMRLVGASSLYIQLPFLLEGAIAGLVGGLLAAGGLLLAQQYGVEGWLVGRFQFTNFIGWDEVLMISGVMLAVGVALSLLASFITLRRYLRV